MKAAVILSGCGYLDGAEIRESVLSLLYLDAQGVQASCFAPDKAQHHVVNHMGGASETGGRNCMHEAARIARGAILPLDALRSEDFDMLVIPGGYGVAKNLSSLALDGADAKLDASFQAIVQNFYKQKKPILAICIAPAVLALALPNNGIALTIGSDEATVAIIVQSGNFHQRCASDEACVDEAHRIVSCSAYMREDALSTIACGIERGVKALLVMAESNTHSHAA